MATELRHRKTDTPTTQRVDDDNKSRGVKENRAARQFYTKIGIIAAFTSVFLANLLLPPLYDIHELPPLTPAMAWERNLRENDGLKGAELVLQGVVKGAESLVIDRGHLYTGGSDGWLVDVDLSDMSVKKLVQFGTGELSSTIDEPTTGRPLGMRMDNAGFLIVVDAYYGIYRVNKDTGAYTTLYTSSTPIDGEVPRLLNDVEVGEDGLIYFTVTSTLFYRYQFTDVLLSGTKTGSLVELNTRTNTTRELIKDLLFPNGVQKTHDGGLLVADTFNSRILKYDIKSESTSIWMDGLPGAPDNIRYCEESNSYLIGLVALRRDGRSSIIDIVTSRSWLRRTLANILNVHVIEWWHDLLQRVGILKEGVMVLEVSQDGWVQQSWMDMDGSSGVRGATEVVYYEGDLYIGSYNHAIARLKDVRLAGLPDENGL